MVMLSSETVHVCSVFNAKIVYAFFLLFVVVVVLYWFVFNEKNQECHGFSFC